MSQHTLPHLRSLLKRSPSLFLPEFQQQLAHFRALSATGQNADELLEFIVGCVGCYPEYVTQVVEMLMERVKKGDGTAVKGVCELRNRNHIAPTELIPHLFPLFETQNKTLRKMIYNHIVQDIKNQNKKTHNHKINKQVQNYIFALVHEDQKPKEAKMALQIMITLYQRGIWNDAKTVNIIATAFKSKTPRLVAIALQFFTTVQDEQAALDSDDDEIFTDKNNNRQFSGLHLVYDPQSLVETLYKLIRTHSQNKLPIITLISRLISTHQLAFLEIYPYLTNLMKPNTPDVTHILTAAAEATHNQVDPTLIEGMVKTIAHQFVNEGCVGEVMCVGLNAIREILSRNQYGISEDLLQDLTEYKRNRDKGVIMAARSLIGLFRKINPSMLKKIDRGKDCKEVNVKSFGQIDVVEGQIDEDKDSNDDEVDEEEELESGSEEEMELDSDGQMEEDSETEDDSEMSVEEDGGVVDLKPVAKTMKEDKKRSKKVEESESDSDAPEYLDRGTIEKYGKKKKNSYEERVAAHKSGTEGNLYGSKKGRKTPGQSTTNKEKAKKKNQLMIVKSFAMRDRKRMSLREKQKQLRGNKTKKKSKY